MLPHKTSNNNIGKAVGVRNFPDKGIKGESFLRECYEKSIADLGGCFLPQDDVCVDFGCGTGKISSSFLFVMFLFFCYFMRRRVVCVAFLLSCQV
jgi:hypothetical protein